MKKPISKRDAHIKELRRIADYANGLAYDNGDESATLDDAIERVLSFRELPGGDTYDSIHGELIAKGQINQAKELEGFHDKAVKAHHEFLRFLDQGQPASHWIGPDGQPIDYTAVPVENGKIGGEGYKVLISKDFKNKCFALAKAANEEADFISQLSELDGTAKDVFFGTVGDFIKCGDDLMTAFERTVAKLKTDERVSGIISKYANASYDTRHKAYSRWGIANQDR